jgi:hypothetical protein
MLAWNLPWTKNQIITRKQHFTSSGHSGPLLTHRDYGAWSGIRGRFGGISRSTSRMPGPERSMNKLKRW